MVTAPASQAGRRGRVTPPDQGWRPLFFASMDEREKLLEVWRDFFPRIGSLKESSEPYPADWEGVIDAAVYAKRQWHYAGAALMLTETMVYEGTIYSGALSGLYKTLAAGDLSTPGEN